MTEIYASLDSTPFIEEIRTDLNEYNKGRFMIITGPPGEAKSMVALRIAEKVDSKFNLDKIAMGKGTEFIKLLKLAMDGKMQHGEVLLFDEAGVGDSAREWQSAQNRILSLIFQTIRKLGIMVLITVPALRMIDIHSRVLAKNYGNAKHIDRVKKRSIFSFYNLQYDDWNDLLKRYKLRDADGKKIDVWEMALPTTIKLDEYEEHKNEMLRWLFNRAEPIFEQMENEGKDNGTNEKLKKERGMISTETVIGNAIAMGTTDTYKLMALSGLKERRVQELKNRYIKTAQHIVTNV